MSVTSLSELSTESPHPGSAKLDQLATQDLLTLINDEDQRVPLAVRACIPEIALTVEAVAARLAAGGRLFYVGAGTSGRLGCVDASEMPPTYGVDPEMVQGLIAGGREALVRSLEGAEDDGPAGVEVIRARAVGTRDAVVGLSVSGRARFVREALMEAARRGAFTACITNNANAQIRGCAEVSMVAETGPEVVTGSTRMKAGTAQKLILNMLSTSVMVKLGRVQGNRMVDLQIKCEKLRERARNLVMEQTGVSAAQAEALLDEANGSVREALARAKG